MEFPTEEGSVRVDLETENEARGKPEERRRRMMSAKRERWEVEFVRDFKVWSWSGV